ncbi:hypothetical protein B296_00058699 [Ensete ventricosum]|uniref:Uncharacterized protein n=1 Tax=Ensete ventricosum TaxID=4639 RepID=A0A426X5G7_ENSVE|nr:hypothetical protein B296_00058699 [Ensete ventricosum]
MVPSAAATVTVPQLLPPPCLVRLCVTANGETPLASGIITWLHYHCNLTGGYERGVKHVCTACDGGTARGRRRILKTGRKPMTEWGQRSKPLQKPRVPRDDAKRYTPA